MRLKQNDRVCIIGGGPAGSFAALHLIKLSKEQSLNLEILIFEPRDFKQPGPTGCNRCAGILSNRLIDGLNSLDIQLPPSVIQSEIRSYVLHFGDDVIPIHQPEPSHKIYSVYRGSGPRLVEGKPLSGLDEFLLKLACERGAIAIPSRVLKVEWKSCPVIVTHTQRYECKFMVLATGVNSRAPLNHHYGYRPPPTEIMAQDEIKRPENWSKDLVNAYFGKQPGLIFGAIIPKGPYLNISILGKKLTRDSIGEFIITQGLKERLPGIGQSLCGCTPRISAGAAHSYFGDAWVAVGDAAVSRLYKDGIGSAFITSGIAMQIAMTKGIHKTVLKKHYKPLCQKMAADNQYCRLIYRLWRRIYENPILIQSWKELLIQETGSKSTEKPHVRILWGMFTGDELYRDLFLLFIQPKMMLPFIHKIIQLKRRHSNT